MPRLAGNSTTRSFAPLIACHPAPPAATPSSLVAPDSDVLPPKRKDLEPPYLRRFSAPPRRPNTCQERVCGPLGNRQVFAVRRYFQIK